MIFIIVIIYISGVSLASPNVTKHKYMQFVSAIPADVYSTLFHTLYNLNMILIIRLSAL
jgi:hypothetical protein